MNWYEDEVARVEKERFHLLYTPDTIFYGSSSFTLWESMYLDLEAYKPINLGFGGSTIAACCWFFERIVGPVTSPRRLLIYAGDNDLGDGRNPEEVYLFYKLLISEIRGKFGDVDCYYISIKPSLKRWELISGIRTANRLIQEETEKDPNQHFIDIFPHMLTSEGVPEKAFFESDGLHLSAAGYALWTEIIKKSIQL